MQDRYPESRYSDAENGADEFRSIDLVYQELGIKAFSALTNCLDLVGKLGSNDSRAVNAAALEQVVSDVTEKALARLLSEIEEIKVHLEQWESRLSGIEAGLKRIDRFTIDAFRELEEMKREADESREADEFRADRGRLAKEEAARLALEAGIRMREAGRRLSLASVAREAGLKYGQIVYAFGNKDAFFTELEKEALEGGNTLPDRAG